MKTKQKAMMEGFSEMMTCKMIQYVLFQTFLYIHVLKKLNGIWVFGLNFALYVQVR